MYYRAYPGTSRAKNYKIVPLLRELMASEEAWVLKLSASLSRLEVTIHRFNVTLTLTDPNTNPNPDGS